MNAQKFTPGPWKFNTNQDWTIRSAAHSRSLMGNATCYPWVPENKADWHLIAAAPELYEALEMMIIGSCACAIPHAGERAVLEKAVIHARAALKKARGE